MEKFKNLKFCIGPMSKNIVDSLLEYDSSMFGILPSRRQIDCHQLGGGYVNNWTTEVFAEYVHSNNKNIILQRDHSGPLQGTVENYDAVSSLIADLKSDFDLIHIDPWKVSKSIDEAVEHTIALINFCELYKKKTCYEIGTESYIYQYSASELEQFLFQIKRKLTEEIYNKIVFVVIQSGTQVAGLGNIGRFDTKICQDMVSVCNEFSKLSKEHNSDYLTSEEMEDRIGCGVSCLNIAPEFGVAETNIFINKLIEFSMNKELEEFKKLCFDSGKWKRWVGDESYTDLGIAQVCGHYQFAKPEFLGLKQKLMEKCDFDLVVKNCMKIKLGELSCLIKK